MLIFVGILFALLVAIWLVKRFFNSSRPSVRLPPKHKLDYGSILESLLKKKKKKRELILPSFGCQSWYLTSGRWNYVQLDEVLKNEQVPAMIVDLQALHDNVATLVGPPTALPLCPSNSFCQSDFATSHKKNLRIATKSIRVPDLIKSIIDSGAPFSGLMCYSVDEAEFLHNMYRMDDLLVAYPTVQLCALNIVFPSLYSDY